MKDYQIVILNAMPRKSEAEGLGANISIVCRENLQKTCPEDEAGSDSLAASLEEDEERAKRIIEHYETFNQLIFLSRTANNTQPKN